MNNGRTNKVGPTVGSMASASICVMLLCGVVMLGACSKKDTAGKIKPVAVKPAADSAVKVAAPAAMPKNDKVVPAMTTYLHGEELLKRLQAGGLVLFTRHFHTDHTDIHEDKTRHHKKNLNDAYFKDCKMQRPLSDYGRLQASTMGKAMSALDVKLGRVVSSPYCRTVEGAELITGHKPEVQTELIYRKIDFSAAMANAHVIEHLQSKPAPGSNVLLMGHRPPMDNLDRIWEGESFIFEPKADGKYDLVGRVRAEGWSLATVDIRYLGAAVHRRSKHRSDGLWIETYRDYPVNAFK
jgi:phosphohistidine phosphatase SixA